MIILLLLNDYPSTRQPTSTAQRVVVRRGSGFSMPQKNWCGARGFGGFRAREARSLGENVAPQPIGTGATGPCGRDSAERCEGMGNWKGRPIGAGRRPEVSRARSSIFFVAAKVSGEFFSSDLAALIESHMLQGCSPSKVFFAPSKTDPSCVV